MIKNKPTNEEVERLVTVIRKLFRILLISGKVGKPAKGLIPFNPFYFQLLGYLFNNGATRPSKLSVVFNVARSTVSTASKALQRKDLIKSISDPEDGRAQLLQLTEQGEKVVEAIHEQDTINMRYLLAFIDSKERSQVLQLLEKITNQIK